MASESRNLAQQRREKDGIVYFERGILTGRDGRRYQRYAIQTHFVEVGESAAELVKKYVLPLAQPGDVLSITAKVMAMCTGNVRRMEEMKLGFFAKHMAKFAGINSTGVGMHEPYKLQLVIDMVGLPRVLLAAFCSAVTKLFGKKGVFYKVCGHEVDGIDGLPLKFHAYTTGNAQWPYLSTKPGMLGISDWRKYRILRCGVRNTGSVACDLKITVRDTGNKYAVTTFPLKAGFSGNCEIKTASLAKQLDLAKIRSVDFALSKPEKPVNLLLTTLELDNMGKTEKRQA